MIVEAIETPNPQVMNFFAPEEFLSGIKAEFSDAKSLHKSPLASEIFNVSGGIKSVFLAPDMISVTKEDTSKWTDLSPKIVSVINDFFVTGQKAVLESFSNDEPSIVEKIKSLIDSRIRPALQKDGGDIGVLDFRDGVLYVSLQGNCSGCPYAMVTLKEGVEKVLKQYIPEIKAVVNEE